MVRQFSATVVGVGSKVLLELPFDADEAWGARECHYVAGTVGGFAIRGVLERRGNAFVLPLGPAWRRDSPVEAGQTVAVVLAPEGPLPSDLAADFAEALASEPGAAEFFRSIAPFYRKNYVRWVEDAKRPATRAFRISEAVARLKAGERER